MFATVVTQILVPSAIKFRDMEHQIVPKALFVVH